MIWPSYLPRVRYAAPQEFPETLYTADKVYVHQVEGNPDRYNAQQQQDAAQLREALTTRVPESCPRVHVRPWPDACRVGAAAGMAAGTAVGAAMVCTALTVLGAVSVGACFAVSLLLWWFSGAQSDYRPAPESLSAAEGRGMSIPTRHAEEEEEDSFHLSSEARLSVPKREGGGWGRHVTFSSTNPSAIYIYPTANLRPFIRAQDESTRPECVVNTLTVGHLGPNAVLQAEQDSGNIFCNPVNAQLCQQTVSSIEALSLPDSRTQVARAIKHAWNLSTYANYRANLPAFKPQSTVYLHTMMAVETPQRLYLAYLGECTAHLVQDNRAITLVQPESLLGQTAHDQLDACYPAGPQAAALPLRLRSTKDQDRTEPSVMALSKSTLTDALLVIASPGLFESLNRAKGRDMTPWLEALVPSRGPQPARGFVGPSFGLYRAPSMLMVMRLSNSKPQFTEEAS